MTDFIIPCEPLARLARLCNAAKGDWFNTVRYDNGVLVACDAWVIACEFVGGPAGVFHILNDPALMETCESEGKWRSSLHLTVISDLQIATAKTTLGYQYPGNPCCWSKESNEIDRWRSIVARVADLAPVPSGAMFWDADTIANLAKVSPSGGLVFEECIDANRGVLVRDLTDPNWFAMFSGVPQDHKVTPAAMPSWFVRP